VKSHSPSSSSPSSSSSSKKSSALAKSSRLVLNDVGILPILYSKEQPIIPRVVMLQYFKDCVEMMLDDENMREVVHTSYNSNKGLHVLCAEFQRDVMKRSFQIEKNFGYHISTVPSVYSKNTELLNAG